MAHRAPRSWLRLTAAWSGAAIALAAGGSLLGAAWLLLTTPGARYVLERVASASGAKVAGVEGRLIGPLAIAEWQLATPAARTTIRDVAIDWSPSQLTVPEVRIDTASAREVVVETISSNEPPRLPDSLVSPLRVVLAVRIGELRVGTLDSGKPPVSIRNLQATVLGDAGQWQVRDLRAETPVGSASISGSVGMASPFPVAAAATWSGLRDGAAYRIDARATGALERIRVVFEGADGGITGGGEADLLPFARLPLERVDARIRGINLAGFARAPRTRLDVEAQLITDATGTLLGPVRIANGEAGPWNRGQLPIAAAHAKLTVGDGIVAASGVDLALPGKGRVRGNAIWAQGKLDARLDVRDANLAALHADLQPTALAGALVAQVTAETQSFTVSLADPRFAIDGAATLAAGKLTVSRALVKSGGAQAQLRGELGLTGDQAFTLEGSLDRANPAALVSTWPAGELNGALSARGRLTSGTIDEATLAVSRSRLGNQPLEGDAVVSLDGSRLRRADINATLGSARLVTRGAFGKAGDRFDLVLKAPDIAPAATAFGQTLAGEVTLEGRLEGTLAEPSGRATFNARKLSMSDGIRIELLASEAELAAGRAGVIRATASLAGLSRAGTPLVERADLALDGSRASHRASLDARFPGNRSSRVAVAGALGEAKGEPEWRGTVGTFDVQVATPVSLVAPAPLVISRQLIELKDATLRGEAGEAQLLLTRWANDTLEAKGRSRGVVVRTIMRILGLEDRLSSSLELAGEWDVRLGDRVEGYALVRRERGDLRVGDPRRSLGLQALELRADAVEGRVKATLDVQSRLAGTVRAEGSAAVVRNGLAWSLDRRAPVAGRFAVDIPDLAWAAAWVGPDAQLAGQVQGEGTLAGTLIDPVWSGRLDATKLALREPVSGAEIAEGNLSVALDNREARIERFTLSTPWKLAGNAAKALAGVRRAEPGTLSAQGRLDLGTQKGSLTLKAGGFPLTRLDTRFLAVSGEARADLDGPRIAIAGEVIADAGWFGIPASAAPSLGDDVVIDRGKPAERSRRPEQVRLDLRLGLGDRLYFQGRGIDTRLAGSLRVTGEPGVNLRANGTMRTVGGTYEAFGRTLTLERGALNFVGPLDNPGLNVLALRKGLPVEAGVEIAGTVSRPRARLASIPEVPEPDKLAWLVLGRPQGDVSASDAALLVGAANSLFGGDSPASARVLGGLGLDEFGIGRDRGSALGALPQSTVAGRTRSATPAEVFTVGKRLGDDLTVSYQQGLAETEGSLRVAWQLTRSLQLILRAGYLPGIDAVYRFSFN